MKVLHVLPSLDHRYGGPLRLVVDLSARSQNYQLESEVLGVGAVNIPDNPLDSKLMHSVQAKMGGSYVYAPEIKQWLAANLRRFDGVVVHGAWTYPGFAAAQACRIADIPYAAFPHGMLERWAVYGQGLGKTIKKRLYWFCREQQVYNHAARVFFTTVREQQEATAVFRFPAKQAILPVYGIERQQPADAPYPDRPDLREYCDGQYALFLGRLHPKKNVDFLLRAWREAKLPRSWRLLIAGSGEPEYERSLHGLAETLGLKSSVHFLGFVAGSEKAYLLQRARWFLLPSKQENFGVAVLEAISNGCPVAISNQVYLAESFGDEAEVLPVQLADWVDFLSKRMISDNWRQESLARDRDHLLKHFEMSKITKLWSTSIIQAFTEGAEDGMRRPNPRDGATPQDSTANSPCNT
jgi:glycosyltransferase involved in cell wall biosynthesis